MIADNSTAGAAIIGAAPPPPGVVPDFENGESNAIHVVLASVLCPAFAVPLVLLRFYTAKKIIKLVRPDDWLILISLMFALVYSVNQLFQVRYGCGRHMWEVRMEDYIVYNKLGVVGSITYNMSTLFTKVSILCFYLRFSPEGTAFRVVVYCVMFVSVGYSVAGALGFSYLCRPITSSWDYRIPGKCVNVVAWYLSCAVLNAATDLVILLLPLWLIRPLRVRLSQKVAVGLILSCGGFVCAVSIYRLAAFLQGKGDMDLTWRYSINLMWCVLEMYVGIICSCLPCLKPFVKHVFPKLFRRSTDPERNQMALGTRFMSAGNSFAWIRTRTIGGGSGRRNARARHRGDTETIDTVEITGMGLRVDDKANSSATTMASSTTLRSEKNQPSKVVPFGAAVGVETAAIAATAPVLPNAANMTAGLQDQNSSESRTNTAAPSTNGSEMARQRSVEDMV